MFDLSAIVPFIRKVCCEDEGDGGGGGGGGGKWHKMEKMENYSRVFPFSP